MLGSLILLFCFVGRACILAPSAWQIETVDSDGNVGRSLSLCLDDNSNPHISYHEYADGRYGNLKYAYYNGTSWRIERVENGGGLWDAGVDTSLALDKDGHPHISYGGHSNAPKLRGALKHIYHDGFTWQPIEVIDYVRYETTLSSLALDETNQAHVSYFDDANGTLKYARRSGSAWTVDIVDEVSCEGGSTSLALDSMGRPHISYYHPYYNPHRVGGCTLGGVLKHTYFDGSTWIIEVVDDVEDPGAFSSLALDAQDRPHISYSDWGNNQLKYAWHDGTTWQIEVVDAGKAVCDVDENVGYHTSLALDSSNRPHISYLAIDCLKYAYNDGSGWQIETIDRIATGYTSISLSLDQADRAHVAYYDRTEQDLKYAYRTSAP